MLPLLGFPPLGWILERVDEKTSQFAQDQLMRIVSGINRDRLRSGTRSVLMTAVKPGGGTTSLCMEFAMEFERLGVRTLVVEANAFKPDARFAGEGERPGLSAIILGRASFESAIVPGTGDLPDRIAIGDRQGSRHLAKATELRSALEGVADRYQMILIDAPPLLLSGDTELLAGQVDATILIVEGDALGGGEIKRAVRTLENAGPEAVGALMNRVRLLEGGGYVGELIEEFQSAERRQPNKLLSPWLWK
jgi:Mrp family chromosome partitioning ATPase